MSQTSSQTPIREGITPHPIEPAGGPPADFDPVAVSRETLRRGRTATLATLDPGTGYPLATMVNLATDADGSPIFLASRLSLHTRNIDADARVSILVATLGKGDPMAASARLSVAGRAQRCAEPRVRQRFLARHPKAALYADFPDFSFFRVQMEALHLNGGFARAAEIPVAKILLDLSGAEALLEAEAGAVVHMNEDHADAIALYATRLCGRGEGAWRMSGLDPEGADLVCAEETARLVFPERLTDRASMRTMLVRLAGEARAKGEAAI